MAGKVALVTLVFLSTLVLAGPAQAQERDAASLVQAYEKADAARPDIDRLVEAAQDQLQAFNSWNLKTRGQGPFYCPAPSVTLKGPQLMTLIRDLVTEDPALFGKQDWRYALVFALVKTFPCG